MKALLLSLFLVIAGTISGYSQAIGIGQFTVINSSTTTPKQLTNSVLLVQKFTVVGKSTYQGSGNSGSLWIGTSATDGINGYEVTSGSIHEFTPPQKGGWIDLSTIYFDVATANDGLYVIYE